MSRIINAIVECRVQEKDPEFNKTFRKALKDVMSIEGNCIVGNPIGGLITDPLWEKRNNPCIVPDFGHNNSCKCEHKEEHGVMRLVGLTFAVDGFPNDKDIFGTYQISHDTQLEICGMSCDPDPEVANGVDLKKIA